jgi:ssDNA-binding Zn-finger/Zn-ribbon topoisomerase 1
MARLTITGNLIEFTTGHIIFSVSFFQGPQGRWVCNCPYCHTILQPDIIKEERYRTPMLNCPTCKNGFFAKVEYRKDELVEK